MGCFLILIGIGSAGYLFREPLLAAMGQFMAPQNRQSADLVILEGNAYIYSGFIQTGIEMLKNGRAKKMVVVLHRMPLAHHPFGASDDYPAAVVKRLKEIGLAQNQFQVVVTPVDHPVTLTEAKSVFENLGSGKIASAILIAQAFHTRRSYLVYASVASPFGIKIYPQAAFTEFQAEKWWTTGLGKREFLLEFGKLVYYLICRHIPFKFSYE